MDHQEVIDTLNDPLAQELLRSNIPARVAYTGLDGFPRAMPIGFHWNGVQFILATSPKVPKVRALNANPKVALAYYCARMVAHYP
jgi:nitroimidazol reductase NimA-like FMN-containing flavoprotein (pyridoxamine 5'-phosphate oxidase superfamily)